MKKKDVIMEAVAFCANVSIIVGMFITAIIFG